MTKRVLGVVAVFGLGVGFGCAAAPLVVPRASAQQAATLPAWEYRCESNANNNERNQLGAERWEMVGLTTAGSNTLYCFKRPKM